MERYAFYANQIRQEIHRHPEIGYDLSNTLAIIRRELTGMGIPYTERFGKSSIVATIHPEKLVLLSGSARIWMRCPFRSRRRPSMHPPSTA